MVGGVWNGFLLGKMRGVVGLMGTVTSFGMSLPSSC